MYKALFDKDHGYYRTKNPIGKNSDFITAPEISQIFGEITAAYILQIFATKRNHASLVEMGAGKGTWFYDILNTIQKLADKKNKEALDFIELVDFHIIEINPILKEIQQKKLHKFSITWHENFDEFLVKNSGEIFFISNELFDCFPIDQFIKTDIGWCERLTDLKLFFIANFNPKIHQFIEEKLGFFISQNAPINAVFEYSLAAEIFFTQLCQALKTKGGIAINFDYGYDKNDFANTLQAIKNHQKIDPLLEFGNVDISAHVNFVALDKIAQQFSLKSSLVSQAYFLSSLEIKERAEILIKQNLSQKNEINSAIDRLISPNQMGELFKCHIIWK
jgi:SAM-dependent MidA family methyltransferase